MTVSNIEVRNSNGTFIVSTTVKKTDAQVEEYEGIGDSLAEALFDLGDLLDAARL